MNVLKTLYFMFLKETLKARAVFCYSIPMQTANLQSNPNLSSGGFVKLSLELQNIN